MNAALTPARAASLSHVFNLTALMGINGLLLIALFDQFVLGELPCPLCLLQRVAFIMVGMGFLFNVRYGAAPLHYGLIILSALAGAFASGRQILLHIVPGTGAYGSALFGLHFYTWAFIAFMLILLAVGLILWVETGVSKAPATVSRFGHGAGVLLAVVVLVNVVATFLECGFRTLPRQSNPLPPAGQSPLMNPIQGFGE